MCTLEGYVAPLAERLQAMVSCEWLEQPERVQRARHSDRAEVDTNRRECVLKDAQVEGCVVRDEHRSFEECAQLEGDLTEGWRGCNVLVADPVHSRRFGWDRPRRANESRESSCLDAAAGQPHDCERHDLIPAGCRPGRLAVEHRVRARRRYVRAPLRIPWGATNTD